MMTSPVALVAMDALAEHFSVLHDAWYSATNDRERLLPETDVQEAAQQISNLLLCWCPENSVSIPSGKTKKGKLSGVDDQPETNSHLNWVSVAEVIRLAKKLEKISESNVASLIPADFDKLQSISDQMSFVSSGSPGFDFTPH